VNNESEKMWKEALLDPLKILLGRGRGRKKAAMPSVTVAIFRMGF
jgi:hypothetical protein